HLSRLAAQPPVTDQHEIRELLFAPEALVFGLALAVVVEHPVGRFPVVLVSGEHLPSGEIDSGIERAKTLIGFGGLFRRRPGRRQLPKADIPEMALGTFRFQADVPFARAALRTSRDLFAVHRQLDRAVIADDAVVVPFRRGMGAMLAGETAHPALRML